MLKIDDLHVYRGRTYVLKGISMHIPRGEVVALIGANGAGKTTTLKTISGLFPLKQGSITYRQTENEAPTSLAGFGVENIVSMGICHCPEGRGIFAGLTTTENLMTGAYLRRDKDGIREDHQRVCDLFPILRERKNQTAGSLSGGEQAMLAIGRALMGRPKLLLLDEPSLGLAPMMVATIFEMLHEINKQGITILLVEQNAVLALELAHWAYVLEIGQVALSGPSQEVANNDRVREAYLGGRA